MLTPSLLARQASSFWQHLTRRNDYPVLAADWARLCDPRALRGPHDWGLAVGVDREHAGRKARNTPLGDLYRAFGRDGDHAAGEALAALLARFMQHLQLQHEFDLACTLPTDYLSGDGDATSALFGWPGVDYPLPVRAGHFGWRMAAGLGAAGSEHAMTLTCDVTGRRILIVTDYYRFDPICSAVHLLQAGGASKVGVLTLCADPGDLHDR